MDPVLFNIFLSELFLVVKDVKFANYADDNTIHQSGRNVDDVINNLQLSAEKLFRWFSDDQMKGNTGRCYLIVSTNNTPELKVGDSLTETSTCEKLVGVKIDYKVTFDNLVANLCKKANNKLRALAGATPKSDFILLVIILSFIVVNQRFYQISYALDVFLHGFKSGVHSLKSVILLFALVFFLLSFCGCYFSYVHI